MLGVSFRSRLVVSLAALTIGVSLLGLPAASAASGPVTGLSVVPQPPKAVNIVWDAYSDFTVDHYEVSLSPGDRFKQVSADTTSAVFGDLSWSQSYTAEVVAVDAGGTESPPATLELLGTRLIGSVSPTTARRGSDVTVSGSLKWRSGAPIPNARVVVLRAFYPEPIRNTDFVEIGTDTTNANGLFSLKDTAVRNAQYRVLYKGQPATEPTVGGWDSNIDLTVTTPIKMRVSPNPVAFGDQVRFRGKVQAPSRLVKGEDIRLQRRESGQWLIMAAGSIKANGSYSIPFTPRSTADQAWRVITGPSDFFAGSASQAKVLTVN